MLARISAIGCLLFLLSLGQTSSGCTIIYQPVTKFDPSEYVFTGEVKGYLGPVRPTYVVGQAYGLLIKVTESVHLPKTPADQFEVFPYLRDDDCSTLGTSREQLIRSYPVGSKVLVVAKEAKLDAAGEGRIRLFVEDSPNALLGRINEGVNVSIRSKYDYRKYKEGQGAVAQFELRKELLRLSEAKTEGQRAAILKRLVYYPRQSVIDYGTIAKTHLTDKSMINRLIKERELWVRRLTHAQPDAN